ncbi:MAG: 4'-phosphopantetheinyl transferase superfamily protein [Clostridia bacterium]|nr:4'-phosphopantetheinyl transferase superfamily protein [Clostridia bacterium]
MFEKYYGGLRPYRRSKADQTALHSGKVLSVGAGALLEKALDRFGVSMDTLEFSTVGGGKPVIVSSDGVHFNISHSGERVMCAVSEKPVGCDVELVRKYNVRIAERFFAKSEYARILSASDEEERLAVFFRLWTLKESFMKTTGMGFSLPMNEFVINIDNKKISVSQSVDRNEYYFAEYDPGDGYKYACCCLKDDLPAKMERVVFD